THSIEPPLDSASEKNDAVTSSEHSVGGNLYSGQRSALRRRPADHRRLGLRWGDSGGKGTSAGQGMDRGDETRHREREAAPRRAADVARQGGHGSGKGIVAA